MRRRYFFAVALLSLLMSAGTVWWWINSGSHMNQLTFRQSSGDTLRVLGCDGKLLLSRTLVPSDKGDKDPQPTQLTWLTVPYTPGAQKDQPELKWSSFHYAHDTLDKGVIESSLVLPVWVITACFAVAPLIWFHKKLKLVKKLAA
jgi:hypothetical protein